MVLGLSLKVAKRSVLGGFYNYIETAKSQIKYFQLFYTIQICKKLQILLLFFYYCKECSDKDHDVLEENVRRRFFKTGTDFLRLYFSWY